MEEMDRTIIRLCAVHGTPLEEPVVRSTVVAAAQALAERSGVRIFHVTTTVAMIQVELELGGLAAIGFAAELRAITNGWYEERYRDGPLWGTQPPDPDHHGGHDGHDGHNAEK